MSKVKKINLIKFELKWIEQWRFLLIIVNQAPDYGRLSGKTIFYNFVKKFG